MPTGPPGMIKDFIATSGVVPASCFGDCFHDCIVDGGMSKSGCSAYCTQECGNKPRDPGPGPAPNPGPSGLPIYGNHCGPGYGAGNGPPIDAVDAACQAHDACYDARGYFNCGCDRTLLNTLPGAIAATASPAGQAAGVAILTYFSRSPCTCSLPLCFPPLPCTYVAGIGGIGPC